MSIKICKACKDVYKYLGNCTQWYKYDKCHLFLSSVTNDVMVKLEQVPSLCCRTWSDLRQRIQWVHGDESWTWWPSRLQSLQPCLQHWATKRSQKQFPRTQCRWPKQAPLRENIRARGQCASQGLLWIHQSQPDAPLSGMHSVELPWPRRCSNDLMMVSGKVSSALLQTWAQTDAKKTGLRQATLINVSWSPLINLWKCLEDGWMLCMLMDTLQCEILACV